jgi:hypothetical protein
MSAAIILPDRVELADARRAATALGHELGRWGWNDSHVRAHAVCRQCRQLAHVEAGDAYGMAITHRCPGPGYLPVYGPEGFRIWQRVEGGALYAGQRIYEVPA